MSKVCSYLWCILLQKTRFWTSEWTEESGRFKGSFCWRRPSRSWENEGTTDWCVCLELCFISFFLLLLSYCVNFCFAIRTNKSIFDEGNQVLPLQAYLRVQVHKKFVFGWMFVRDHRASQTSTSPNCACICLRVGKILIFFK